MMNNEGFIVVPSNRIWLLSTVEVHSTQNTTYKLVLGCERNLKNKIPNTKFKSPACSMYASLTKMLRVKLDVLREFATRYT